MFKRCKITTAILTAMGLAAPGVALSQTSGGGENEFLLEEIIVTARKVGESIQDIPLSVQAFSAEQISKQQIVDVEDLVQFTPGVNMLNQIGNRNNPTIRFRGIDPPSAERNKQISSTFLDGVYLPGTSQWISMNDVERVEVVKGPQSAFFGRATFSGAINFVTKTPGDEFAADVQAIVGDNGRMDIWGAAEGAIIPGKLTARVSGRFYEFDGAWDNSPPPGGGLPGEEYGDLGAQETTAGSITLYATPTEDLAIKFRYVNSEDEDGPSPVFLVKGENNNCGPFNGGTDTYYCGTLSPSLITTGGARTTPLEEFTYADAPGMEREIDFTSLTVDWDIAGSGYTLSSVTGMYNEDLSEYRTLLEDELDVFREWEDESFSQEFRLASPQDSRFRWMVGAYYLDLEYGKDGTSAFPCAGQTAPALFCTDFSDFQVDGRGGRGLFAPTPANTETVENKAIFGSVNFDFTESLTLSVELRREEETISNANELIQEAPPLDPARPIETRQPMGGASVPVEGEFSATLPRVILDYTFNDNTMAYVSYSEGNNPGGFNPEVIRMEPTVSFPAFNADTGIGYTVDQAELKSYEIGAKHTLANGRGYINGAAYLMEWTNQRFRGIQVGVDTNGDGVFITGSDDIGGQVDYDDNGSTDIWGFEVAGAYAFSENWSAELGYNYTTTEIQEYEDGFNLRVRGTRDASGQEIASSPEHTATFGLNYSKPSNMFNQSGEWWGRWDAWFQSETYNWVINLAETEAAWLHNLRGGWRGDRYSVSLWVENVLDDDPVLASQRTTGSFLTQTLGYQLTLPTPRTYGVTFTARFGAN